MKYLVTTREKISEGRTITSEIHYKNQDDVYQKLKEFASVF